MAYDSSTEKGGSGDSQGSVIKDDPASALAVKALAPGTLSQSANTEVDML